MKLLGDELVYWTSVHRLRSTIGHWHEATHLVIFFFCRGLSFTYHALRIPFDSFTGLAEWHRDSVGGMMRASHNHGSKIQIYLFRTALAYDAGGQSSRVRLLQQANQDRERISACMDCGVTQPFQKGKFCLEHRISFINHLVLTKTISQLRTWIPLSPTIKQLGGCPKRITIAEQHRCCTAT